MAWSDVVPVIGFGVFVIAAVSIGFLVLTFSLLIREKHLKPSWDAIGAIVKEMVK